MQDTFGREITYMRISVTEACNMACRYCSPGGADGKEGRRQLLSTDQIVDVCRAAISLGIRNFRFTGGEPLLRQRQPEPTGSSAGIFQRLYPRLTGAGTPGSSS